AQGPPSTHPSPTGQLQQTLTQSSHNYTLNPEEPLCLLDKCSDNEARIDVAPGKLGTSRHPAHGATARPRRGPETLSFLQHLERVVIWLLAGLLTGGGTILGISSELAQARRSGRHL
ncbi:MAG: hypothetical protein E7L50_10915, partial [Cutibacterium avidum]|nr:hypothetical protein [Cutibacterium avidum]